VICGLVGFAVLWYRSALKSEDNSTDEMQHKHKTLLIRWNFTQPIKT